MVAEPATWRATYHLHITLGRERACTAEHLRPQGGALGAISRFEGGLITLAPLLQPLQVDASDGTLVLLGCAKGLREHVVEVPHVPFEMLSVDTDVIRLPNWPPAVERLPRGQRRRRGG